MSHPVFTNRFTWSMEDNAFSQAVKKRRAEGLPLLDLAESNPTQAGLGWSPETLAEAFRSSGNVIYNPHPRGLPATRATVAFYYHGHGITLSPEQIHLTASTSEGYGWLLKLLTNPGDAVLVPAPSYPLLQFLANLECVDTKPYPLLYDQGRWRVDAVSLEKSITPNTRAIFCVTPNNPTGSVLNGTDRAILREAARRHNLALIVDEVFLDYGAHGHPVSSWAGETEVPIFILSGLSKISALPQAKLGWIITAGPEAWRHQALHRLDFIADTYLSVNTPVQNGTAYLLEKSPAIRQTITQRVEQNETLLKDWCATSPHKLNTLPREAGWYSLIELPKGINEEALVLDLIRRDGVSIHPGYFYDMPADGVPHLVISLISQTAALVESIPLIEEALKRH